MNFTSMMQQLNIPLGMQPNGRLFIYDDFGNTAYDEDDFDIEEVDGKIKIIKKEGSDSL